MDYVRAFAKASPDGSAVNTYETDAQYNTKVTSYLDYVGNEFDTSSKKMFIVGREYWLSLFGNGVESFNLYRRTGQPENMQPGLEENAGTFPRSFFYPNIYMVTNTKAVQKANQGVQVFWDKNPAGKSWNY
jgi:hypothetical protein